jgi:D-alanyl-lipoteichoic acid acyltransferase DltB (MBOAT superfamily)
MNTVLATVWNYLWTPIAATPWTAWREFWLQEICDDRLVIVYFLPLAPLLLLVPRALLRIGLIASGLAFVAYFGGVLYAGLWLLTCIALYRLGERFVHECQRRVVLSIGPPLAVGTLITLWYLTTMVLHHLHLPAGLNAWFFEHARWAFPLGARDVSWEPVFVQLSDQPAAGPPFPLLHAMFWNVHNIGIAYLAARMLHYFSELKRGTIPATRRTLLNFLAYTCYGPALLQGPLERFGTFQDELDTCHTRRGWHNLPPALYRITWGVAKSLVATWYFRPLLRDVYGVGGTEVFWQHPEQIQSFVLLYCGVFFMIFWLYLEFSGYCDISAGIARLLGYRQIENFRLPWIATNMRDLWRRWHISLSEILRDYLYIPLGGNRRHPTFNICLTFIIIGLWHGVTPRTAVWGLMMGLFVAFNQHWSRWMKRIDEQPMTPVAAVRRTWLRLQPLPRVCAWLVTQHAFVFPLFFFFGGTGGWRVMREILRRVLQAVWSTHL